MKKEDRQEDMKRRKKDTEKGERRQSDRGGEIEGQEEKKRERY